MKITKKWLNDRHPCKTSFDYVCQNDYIGLDIIPFIEKLIKEKRLSDANWLVTKGMNKKQNVMYAIFAEDVAFAAFDVVYTVGIDSDELIIKILNYGIELIRKNEN